MKLLTEAYLNAEETPVDIGQLFEKIEDSGFEVVFSALQNPDRYVQKKAVGDLARFHSRDQERNSRIVEALKEPRRIQMLLDVYLKNGSSLRNLNWVLRELGQPGLDILHDLLGSDQGEVRKGAADGLASYAYEHSETAVEISEWLTNALVAESSKFTREAIAESIKAIGKEKVSNLAICGLWCAWSKACDRRRAGDSLAQNEADQIARALFQLGHNKLVEATGYRLDDKSVPAEWEMLLLCPHEGILAQVLRSLWDSVRGGKQKIECSAGIMDALRAANGMKNTECVEVSLKILDRLGAQLSAVEMGQKEELIAKRYEKELADRILQLKTGTLPDRSPPDYEAPYQKEFRVTGKKNQSHGLQSMALILRLLRMR